MRTIAIRTIRVSELTAMQRQIADLYDLMALERLRIDANIHEPAAKEGLFVDNFLDDDLRDRGVAQSGAIVAGVLTLPIAARAEHAKSNGNRLLTLDYSLTPVVEQLARTGWVTAQPYQIGVLLSSSNGVTWTPHQSQDLTFRLLACRFAQTARTVDLSYPGMQVVFGALEAVGDYLTRAISAAASFNSAVTFDALTPGASSLAVEALSESRAIFRR